MSDWPIMALTETQGGDAAGYELLGRFNGIAEKPPEGIVLHWAGPVRGGFLTCSIWRDRSLADKYLTGRFSESLVKYVTELGPDHVFPDVSYAMAPAIGFRAGEDLNELAGRPLGSAGGAVAYSFVSSEYGEQDYRDGIAPSLFEHAPPVGLVGHVAGQHGDLWRMFDAWKDDAAARAHYSNAGYDLDAIDDEQQGQRITRIDLHTILVSPPDVAELQSFLAQRELVDERLSEQTPQPLGYDRH